MSSISNNQRRKYLDKITLEALALKAQGNYRAAISLMDGFISKEIDSSLRCEALMFRSALLEDIRDYQKAIGDLLAAYQLCLDDNYRQYVIALGLAGISNKLGKHDDAVSWYRKALLTAESSENTSGGSALKGFLAIKDENKLTRQERVLCNNVVKNSWTILRMSGEPNLSNLKEMAEIIIQEQSKPMK